MKKFVGDKARVDHIAIAVKDLEAAIKRYQDVYGFELIQRREVSGQYSGMVSAELDAGGFKIVLIQGTDPESQVSRYVRNYGPGVQHIAVSVDDVAGLKDSMTDSGVDFATDVIRSDGLVQIFTRREENCGMMFEFIERRDHDGFEQTNIQSLFEQLEAGEMY